MLTFVVAAGGGVQITGSAAELRMLAAYLRQGARIGRVTPSFVADDLLTHIEIVRVD